MKTDASVLTSEEQREVNEKLDESLGPNPRRCISLGLPCLFRAVDGVVEVAADSVAVPFHAFPDVPLELFLPQRGQKGKFHFEGHATKGAGRRTSNSQNKLL